MEGVTVRIQTQADKPAVADLNTRAFGRPDEAQIIERLEREGDVLLQAVAEFDSRLVGHILFYPVGVRGKLGAVGLGPMCVDPWLQRERVGTQLVTAGVQMMKEAGISLIFVLGHDYFYPKFGFNVDATAPFNTPFKGPHFMALRLRFGPPMSGDLIFPEAFGAPVG